MTGWKQFDWILIVSAFLLTLFGIISMISTSTAEGALISRPVLYQTFFLAIGAVAMIFCAMLEYRSVQSFAAFFYAAIISLLTLVLIFGQVRNGSRAWFDFGIVSFQPAEPAKLLFILTLARYFSRHAIHTVKTIFVSLLFMIPVAVLILLEPDVGTLLSFIALWFIMVLSLNLTRRQLFTFIGGSIGLVVTTLAVALLTLSSQHFQIQRLLVFPDHLLLRNTYHTEIGYQVDQSMIAVGSGGINGKGLGHGSQSQFGFLPAETTDFIFASITEEIGLIGSLILIALIVILLVRILRAAQASRDPFGKFICVGVFGLILYHSVQNIGMNIGLLPVTGIPLSLVSYGGSHLITVYAGLGLVESVFLRSKRTA